MKKYVDLLARPRARLRRWLPEPRLTLLYLGVFVLSCTLGVLLRQATG